ncbi:MAG: hypothetical protein NWF05_06410 [Candidatus Bathyarchaeota archaeon]|nr:hypothetical protein [Candidatus Bathyarchaeota archaeon]
MQKTLLAVIAVLILVSLAGLVLFYSAEDVNGGRGYGAQNAQSQRSSWLLVFAVPLAAALVVVVYWVLFPEIKVEKQKTASDESPPAAPVPAERNMTLDAVLRVLNNDERKVVEALAASGEGWLLQKDIRWKTGLSRVKTHRVLARLAARDIVKVEKYYNTNKVALAGWVGEDAKAPDAN